MEMVVVKHKTTRMEKHLTKEHCAVSMGKHREDRPEDSHEHSNRNPRIEDNEVDFDKLSLGASWRGN